jgi:hypothetical protein
MTFQRLIKRVAELASQYPQLDSEARDIVLEAIAAIQRGGHWTFNQSSTTAVVAAGTSTASFTNTNEYLGLQLGGRGGKTSVLVSENAESGVLPVEVWTQGEVEGLHAGASLISRARVYGVQEPIWITRTTGGRGVVNRLDNADGELTYTIKGYFALPALSALSDENELTRQYPDLVVARARADAFKLAGAYDLAEVEENIFRQAHTSAIRHDAYKALQGKPVHW